MTAYNTLEVMGLNLSMISIVLDSDANPNAKATIDSYNNTVCAKFFQGLRLARRLTGSPFDGGLLSQAGHEEIKEATFQILDLLLRHGADPYVRETYCWEETQDVRVDSDQTHGMLIDVFRTDLLSVSQDTCNRGNRANRNYGHGLLLR